MNKVIHFGAGALGRGLVIPLLCEGGYDVIAVDANHDLIKELRNTKKYNLYLTDISSDNNIKSINIKNALTTEEKELRDELIETDIVTTSVKRENLSKIAKTIVEAWGFINCSNKTVICAENIENVGSYFKDILLKEARNAKELENIKQIKIPDTCVDRICTSDWPNSLDIYTETFNELYVGKNESINVNISTFNKTDEIDKFFVRKRFLLNTYADMSAFFAKDRGKKYLFEAINDPEIRNLINPYFSLISEFLMKKYKFNDVEISKWENLYIKRLSNENLKRDLTTVARNLWPKLELHERFILPLIELMHYGINVDSGLSVILRMIKDSVPEVDNDELICKLKDIWSSTQEGIILLDKSKTILKNSY